MKRWMVLCLAAVLLLGGCKPSEQEAAVTPEGTEDGGGLGYGINAQSVLRLSDFYSVTQRSKRTDNRVELGTPTYAVGNVDTYVLDDGNQIILTYNDRGVLSDSTYCDVAENVNYTLFDKLVLMGIIRNSGNTETDTPSENEQGNDTKLDDTPSDSGSQSSDGNVSFATKLYDIKEFGSLALQMPRHSVISAFGAPNAFQGRSYQRDSYILDCYHLSNGSVLMLDYGYQRQTLRCAAIKGADGTTTTYLGTWTTQSKPSDFLRTVTDLNDVTALVKGISPAKVYAKLGEPDWFEGSVSNYKDAYMLTDGSVAYLVYDKGRTTLTEAYQLKADGAQLKVTLR